MEHEAQHIQEQASTVAAWGRQDEHERTKYERYYQSHAEKLRLRAVYAQEFSATLYAQAREMLGIE